MPNELARQLAAFLQDEELELLIDRAASPDAGLAAEVEEWATSNGRQAVVQGLGRILSDLGLGSALDGAPLSVDGWHPRVPLGPAVIGFDSPVATLVVGDKVIPVGLLPPSGASLALRAGPIGGEGALVIGDSYVSGAIGLSLGPIGVAAFAHLAVPDSTPSLVVVLGVRFAPAIQLGFGFGLSAVGGVVGINRRLDTEAIRARLADGSALDLLFPTDPTAEGARVLAALGEIFRPEAGSHVAGPTLTITWLDLGPLGSVVRLDIGLLVALPDARIVIVGRGVIQLPVVLHIRMDMIGEIDVARSLVAVDTVLVDSHALAVFTVTGTATIRMSWGQPPYLVAALGGFFPGFQPEPAIIPPQQRLGLALNIPCPLTVRVSAYLAVTSNSVQVGAAIEVGIDLEVIEAAGSLTFDSIVTFDPFHIHASFSVEWHVEVAIFSGGASASGTIDGPGPWVIHVRVSKDLVFDDVSWSGTFTIGSPGPSAPPALTTISQALDPIIGLPTRLTSDGADDPHVVVEPRSTGLPAGAVVVSPLARFSWKQDLVPLELEVDRVGGRRLGSRQSGNITIEPAGVAVVGDAKDWFAPAAYVSLSQAEAIAQPTYQHLKAGLQLEFVGGDGDPAMGSLAFREYFRRGADWTESDVAGMWAPFGPLVVAGVAAHRSAAVVTDRSLVVTVSDEKWAVTTADGVTSLTPSAIHGLLATRHSGTFLPAMDKPVQSEVV